MVRRALWILTMSGILLAIGGASAQAATTSTVPAATAATKGDFAKLQQDVQAKDYTAALQEAARLLADPSVHNRYDVLMIKAQCHLNLKAAPLAGDAFAAAATATKTAQDTAVATASHELVVNSNLFTYSPKFTRTTPAPTNAGEAKSTTGDGGKSAKGHKKKTPVTDGGADPFAVKFTASAGTAIDIVAADSRKTALAALYVDELAAALPKLESARKGKDIPVILEAISKTSALRPLELAATEADAETSAMVAALVAHADQLMTDALDAQSKQEKQISARANESNSTVTADRRWVRLKRGLSSDDRTALQNMIPFCSDVAAACKALQAVPGVDATVLTRLVTESQALSKRASSALRSRY